MFKKRADEADDDEDSFFDRSDFDFGDKQSGDESSDEVLESDRYQPNRMHLVLFSTTTMADNNLAGVLRIEINSDGMAEGSIIMRLKSTCRLFKKPGDGDNQFECPKSAEQLLAELRPNVHTDSKNGEDTKSPSLLGKFVHFVKNPKLLLAKKLIPGRFGSKKKDLRAMLENISSSKKRPGWIRKPTNLPTLTMPSEIILRTSAKEDTNRISVSPTKSDLHVKKLLKVNLDPKSKQPAEPRPPNADLSLDDSQVEEESLPSDQWVVFSKEYVVFQLDKQVSKPANLFVPFEIELQDSLIPSNFSSELVANFLKGADINVCHVQICHKVQACYKPLYSQQKPANIIASESRPSAFQEFFSSECQFHVHPKLTELKQVPLETQTKLTLSKKGRRLIPTPCMQKPLMLDCRTGISTSILYGKHSCISVQLDFANKAAAKVGLWLEAVVYQTVKQNTLKDQEEVEETNSPEPLMLAKTFSVQVPQVAGYHRRAQEPAWMVVGVWPVLIESTGIISERTILNIDLESKLRYLQTIKSSQLSVQFYVEVFLSERQCGYENLLLKEEIRLLTVPKDARYLSADQHAKLWQRTRAAGGQQQNKALELPFTCLKLQQATELESADVSWQPEPDLG